ncbi:MAG: superoxide dismutase [Bacteroidaceae bacterium]|jgi:Fe-Mn family superoxide dismutase
MTHSLPQLPYAADALAPHMSAETLEYHYGKHFQTYLDNLNKLIVGTKFENLPLEEIVRKATGGIFNNAAQAWNHGFFFLSLTPERQEMPERLAQALTQSFGSVETFTNEFTQTATTLFGSGWAWLAADANKHLSITAESNAGNPMCRDLKPILTIDVWEHAYYIDYRNRRAEYIKAFLEIVDWKKVESRLFD